jgi:hypothetical protein
MYRLAQLTEYIWRGWLYLTHTRSLAMILGIGFAVLAIALFIASRTRWGQTKPLTKAVVLSVLAHVWLLMYVLGTRTVLPQGDPNGRATSMSVEFESDSPDELPSLPDAATDQPQSNTELPSDASDSLAETQPWEQSAPLAALPQPPLLSQALQRNALALPSLLPEPAPAPVPTPMPDLPASEFETAEVEAQQSPAEGPADRAPIQPAVVADLSKPSPVLPPTEPISTPASPPDFAAPPTMASPTDFPPQFSARPEASMPREYELRQAPNRLQLAAPYGADADSEAAVEAGLRWLAQAQSDDGAWDARAHGAGTETHALGESRYGTGDKADTGISGLALLAFLSAGHTHLDGEYQQTVQRGLQYLLRSQMPSGDLSGPKQVGSDRGVLNARMYCHSIATLALAEAYAMTGDTVLREALLKATQYSINAQDPRGGGWRYRPLDAGDLSQFGWQAMALKSVERSGIPIPSEVQVRMRRFLDACAAGPAGGLATYQPKNGRPSETMTAEGLACRVLLGYPITPAAQQEALHMIMKNRPGIGEDNVYFWYYATLALFQLQDEAWRDWNQALKQRLLATQVPAYSDQPGSWTPDKMWGGYGGRVYSTAMSCLCLEVYYRYLPLYQTQVAQGASLNR